MKNKALKQNLIFAAVLAALYIICSAVLTPLYVKVCSDIIYIEGALPYLLEALMEICQFVIWIYLFSHIIKCGFDFRFGNGNISLSFIILTVLLTAMRYFAAPVTAVLLSHGTASYDMTDALLYFSSDTVQLALIFILAVFLKVDNKKKYIVLTAGASAIMLTLIRIIMRVRFDIFYGAPESVRETVIMVMYYSTDILYGIAVYFCTYFSAKVMIKKKNSD